MQTILPSLTDDAVAFLAERAQAEADERADAEYEREQRIERAVTFADLLEELCELDATQRAEFMLCLARANKHDRRWIHCELESAKGRVVLRLLQKGE